MTLACIFSWVIGFIELAQIFFLPLFPGLRFNLKPHLHKLDMLFNHSIHDCKQVNNLSLFTNGYISAMSELNLR